MLRDYLEKDHAFKYATLVHSDTPSGLLNPVEALCPILKKYGILTVVDSVTGMFADELDVDRAQIDIVWRRFPEGTLSTAGTYSGSS